MIFQDECYEALESISRKINTNDADMRSHVILSMIKVSSAAADVPYLPSSASALNAPSLLLALAFATLLHVNLGSSFSVSISPSWLAGALLRPLAAALIAPLSSLLILLQLVFTTSSSSTNSETMSGAAAAAWRRPTPSCSSSSPSESYSMMLLTRGSCDRPPWDVLKWSLSLLSLLPSLTLLLYLRKAIAAPLSRSGS